MKYLTQKESAIQTLPHETCPETVSGAWDHPVLIEKNNFKNKSLSAFSCNLAVGCSHGCLFCYVPETSTNKMATALAEKGVADPDAQWGNYVFLRKWDKAKFLASLKKADEIPEDKLNADGNRAVMFCTTSDPYQVFKNPDSKVADSLNKTFKKTRRTALELIRDKSTLNVRIMTWNPKAKEDFDLFKSFGDRMAFGMSIPTLNDKLAQVYEPHAPSPSKRMETLKAAKDAGISVYVAIAPTYPECGEADIRATLAAVKELDPITIFHEPINVRAGNVDRIKSHAAKLGIEIST
ncbi:MAG: radical SAM protein [Chthoniobacteraceae bacterium]